jgi:hypothetical protein
MWIEGKGARSLGALAAAVLVALGLVAASQAARPTSRAKAPQLRAVDFTLPYAIEGQDYTASIDGAAAGGTKPYRCVPKSLGEGSLAIHTSCIISGKAPTFSGATVGKSIPVVTTLTDNSNPQQKVTIDLHLYIDQKKITADSYNGTYTGIGHSTVTLGGPGKCTHHTITRRFNHLVVGNGAIAGHHIEISALGWGSVHATLHANFITLHLNASLSFPGSSSSTEPTVMYSMIGSGTTSGCTARSVTSFMGTRAKG